MVIQTLSVYVVVIQTLSVYVVVIQTLSVYVVVIQTLSVYVVVFFGVFNDLKWEVVVSFVDVGGITDHLC